MCLSLLSLSVSHAHSYFSHQSSLLVRRQPPCMRVHTRWRASLLTLYLLVVTRSNPGFHAWYSKYPCFLSFGPFHLCYYFHMHPLPFPGLPQLVPTVAMYAVGPSKGPEGSVVSQGPCRSVPALSVAFCPSRPGSCEPLVCVCVPRVWCALQHMCLCVIKCRFNLQDPRDLA